MLRFSCEKALLQSAVNTVSRAVAAKSSIPALEGILVEGSDRLTMSGYNMQTGIRTAFEAEVHEEGRIVLNARLFGEIIRKLPDDLVVFAADEKYMVRLTCGDASFEIMGLSAEDYPELPEVDDEYSVAIQQGTLKAMINQTSFAVSTNETRPIHTGSLFEINEQGLTMVSVDGFRLALRREPLERIDGGAFRFVAPGSALNEVEKICERQRQPHDHHSGQAPPDVRDRLHPADLPPSGGRISGLPQRHPPQQPHLHSGGYQGHAQQSGPCQRGHQ